MPATTRMEPAAPPPATASSAASTKLPRARRCPTCQQAFSGEARFCPFDGDSLASAPDWDPAADPLIGQVIDGRYEVAGVIGEGGMGTVYEVRHTSLGRRFALKVLRRDIADAEHTARFIQEAKAAAAIGHPNIVAVSDFGEIVVDAETRPTKVPYFVMEHLTGTPLSAILRAEKTLDSPRAAALVMQCASALAAAHAAGVIHRDLKPDNIFLTRNGDHEFVKLLDFGVAKMAGAGRLTRAGMVFGTPHYMSPEQAAGQSVDSRADIYALGVILYECLAGHVPFEADTYMGVLTKHMFANPEPIEHVAPSSARLGGLAPVVMRCLAKNPQDRCSTMADLIDAIEATLGDHSVRAGIGSQPSRLRALDADGADPPAPPLKPLLRPVTLVGLGLAAAAVVALLVGRTLQGAEGPATTTTTSAPTPTATATAVAPMPTASAAVVQSAAPAPTAKPPTRPGGTTRPARTAEPTPRKRPGGEVVDPWGR